MKFTKAFQHVFIYFTCLFLSTTIALAQTTMGTGFVDAGNVSIVVSGAGSGTGTAADPIVCDGTGDPVTIQYTVNLTNWTGGGAAFLHGVGVNSDCITNIAVTSLPPGFIFAAGGCVGCGTCTEGLNYPPGFYYDGTSTGGCAATPNGPNGDGDPCNNWGISATTQGPFIFTATVTPGVLSGSVEFIFTGDGCSGGYGGTSGNGSLIYQPVVDASCTDDDLPVPQFTLQTIACNTDGPITPNTTGQTAGGTWSSDPVGLSINPTTGVITPSASTVGNYLVCYTLLQADFPELCNDVMFCQPFEVETDCASCPEDATMTSTSAGECSGGAADIVLGFDVAGVGGLTGSFDLSSSPTGVTFSSNPANAGAVTATFPVNTTCAAITYTISADAECSNSDDIDDPTSLMITVYPGQPTTSVTNADDVCSGQLEAIVVNLVSADGSICDTRSFNAPANETCEVAVETFTYGWTVAELETLTGAPAALACYTAISDSEMVNVYPVQPTADVTNLDNVCTSDLNVVTFALLSGDNTECDSRSFDANENLGCDLVVQNITDTYTALEIETLFAAPTGTNCYTDITLDENLNIYPDANSFTVVETPGECGTAATVMIMAADGSLCFSDTGVMPMNPGCDMPSDDNDLNYSFDPGFADACNNVFAGSIEAPCVGDISPTVTITCPINIDPCDNTIAALNPNPTGGVYTGTSAPFVTADLLNIEFVPAGGYSLVYTYTDAATGCFTSVECNFALTYPPCPADAGSFQSTTMFRSSKKQ